MQGVNVWVSGGKKNDTEVNECLSNIVLERDMMI